MCVISPPPLNQQVVVLDLLLPSVKVATCLQAHRAEPQAWQAPGTPSANVGRCAGLGSSPGL